ncbi:MAG: hypothetical protein HQ502_06015 [Alphaproteobacteria bacterium]|nr:hypothetical protein [Alphaproteobacteria bacterium]
MTHQVIDADGHICETKALWEVYVPRAYRDRTIRMDKGDNGKDRFWINGVANENSLSARACLPWGEDYPHFDCTYPGAVAELEKHLNPIDPALADLVRRENAARFIGLG